MMQMLLVMIKMSSKLILSSASSLLYDYLGDDADVFHDADAASDDEDDVPKLTLSSASSLL